MKKSIWLILLLPVLFIGCEKKDDEKAPVTEDSAKYKVTFSINWNSTDFPTDYPSNAHFSKLIGWSHQATSTFFKLGTKASAGIKTMAETGATTPLDTEITDMITKGEGLKLIIGGNLTTGVGDIVVEVPVDKDNTSITLSTMVAPSPDWYVAVVNVNLMENGKFVNEKNIDAQVYDAGTDDGTTFTSPNAVTDPQATISMFVDAPLGNGTTLNKVIGKVKFEKLME